MTVKSELTKIMSTYGFEILQTLVTDIIPDSQVRQAMNRINAAQREKQVFIYFFFYAKCISIVSIKAALSRNLKDRQILKRKRDYKICFSVQYKAHFTI